MTLDLSWYGIINDANPHYAALSDNDKRFLCPSDLMSDMSVPILLLTSFIGFVLEDTIPHILKRAELVHGDTLMAQLQERSKKWGHANLTEHLRIYIGVTSNIRTRTRSEFLKGLGDGLLGELTRSDINKMLTRMNKMKKNAA